MRHLLGGIHQLADLTTLIRVAGHTPCFQELPTTALGAVYPVEHVALLSADPGFEWVGVVVTGSAPSVARDLARAFARGGRLAAILAFDQRHRALIASISYGTRPTLYIDLHNPSPTALHCLDRLRSTHRDTGVAAAARIAEAFDGEAVGRTFFLAFRSMLDRMVAWLPSRIADNDGHHLALLQLTRILFLYFVQSKGWLDARPRFLREELDLCLSGRRSVHRAFLHPLFFGTLNQATSSRGATARRFGAIPFLNGGLFDHHPIEQLWRIEFPDDLWREVFDDLFERFHFSVRESGHNDIAPDMLGRVFEGVMDPQERGESGTFYTPLEMVDAVVHAGLVTHVSGRLSCTESEAERRLGEPDTATRDVLETITILDPAVGSGGFLLSALNRLSSVAGGDDVETRRGVLSRNLFGVDLNPTAVRLAELRLWLSLIECDHSERPEQVETLPNLDSIVRQGDSLFEPVPPTWSRPPSASDANGMRANRRRLQGATGRAKQKAIRTLREVEGKVFEVMLAEAAATTRAQMADLVAQGRSGTLFGTRRGLSFREERALDVLRSKRRFLLGMRQRLARDGTLPWFCYQAHFAEVFATGGFDLVVGNPPWVRGESLPKATRHQLAARYRLWKTSTTGLGYSHLPDLSVAFLERALELTTPTGTIAFLVPAKLATAGYAGRVREALSTETTLTVVADLSNDPRATFDATTYPMALVTRKGSPPAVHVLRRYLGAHSVADVSQSRLTRSAWVLAPDSVSRTLERMRARHPPLSQRLVVRLGVKTGLNRVFLDPDAPLEPELLCWALCGRDVGPFKATPSRRMLWTHDENGLPLRPLPRLAKHYLEAHEAALKARSDLGNDPPWTLFRVAGAIAPHRVVWADLSRRLEVAALNGPNGERVIPINSCYVIGAPSTAAAHSLTTWLNSTWMRAAAALTADPASAGFRRFNARVVGNLPLPPAVLDDQRLRTLGEAGRRGCVDQQEIDEACNTHLGISADERHALDSLVSKTPHAHP